jgi:hypothetical protein
MWTARASLPHGPRPNAPSNVIAFWPRIYTPAEQERAVAGYKARGYTHAVIGPVAGNDCYHDRYPCDRRLPDQARWNAYLDWVQSLWDAGMVPVYFAKPDNWEKPEHAAEWAALDALHRQPRAQQLLRVVVYCGWEPNGGPSPWSNATYVSCLTRGADVFPHALRYLHATCDVDVPKGPADAALSDADAWRRVMPSIHGYLLQACGYIHGSTPQPSPDFLANFRKLIAGMKQNFAPGGVWAGPSAWDPGGRLQVIAGEYGAYRAFWNDWPEDAARQIGDAAMCAGADGYLDGGTVSVPMTASERIERCR